MPWDLQVSKLNHQKLSFKMCTVEFVIYKFCGRNHNYLFVTTRSKCSQMLPNLTKLRQWTGTFSSQSAIATWVHRCTCTFCSITCSTLILFPPSPRTDRPYCVVCCVTPCQDMRLIGFYHTQTKQNIGKYFFKISLTVFKCIPRPFPEQTLTGADPGHHYYGSSRGGKWESICFL